MAGASFFFQRLLAKDRGREEKFPSIGGGGDGGGALRFFVGRFDLLLPANRTVNSQDVDLRAKFHEFHKNTNKIILLFNVFGFAVLRI